MLHAFLWVSDVEWEAEEGYVVEEAVLKFDRLIDLQTNQDQSKTLGLPRNETCKYLVLFLGNGLLGNLVVLMARALPREGGQGVYSLI